MIINRQIIYRWDLLKGGVKLAELTGVLTMQIGFIRNDYKHLTFSHLGNNLDPVVSNGLVRGSEIRIYRQGLYDNSKLNLIYAGEIQSVKRSVDKNRKKTLEIDVEHWASVFLHRRFVTATFTGQQEENIAWGLINNTQTDTEGGHYTLAQVDCGFRKGTLQATGNSRTYPYVDQEILSALQQLSDATDLNQPQRLRGFTMSPDLTNNDLNVFNYYANFGQVRNITYTNPQIQTMDITDSIVSYADKIVATGNNHLKAISYGIDQNSINFYKKRQNYVPFTNITDPTQLQNAADQQEVVMGNPTFLYSFKLVDKDIYVGQYGVGDTIFLQYQDIDPKYNLFLQLIVFAIDLTYNNTSRVESVSLTVAVTRPVSLEVGKFERLVRKVERSDKRLINLEKQ